MNYSLNEEEVDFIFDMLVEEKNQLEKIIKTYPKGSYPKRLEIIKLIIKKIQ